MLSLLLRHCLRVLCFFVCGGEQRPAAKQSLVSVARGNFGLHFAELSALFCLGCLRRGTFFRLGRRLRRALLGFTHFLCARQGEEGQLLILRVFQAGGADPDEAQGLPL